jgi:hypothetical protein
LRAAPHLETLIICASKVVVDSTWLGHPAFNGLVRSKLKHIRVLGLGSSTPLTSDFVLHLRQRHFPRLKELAIYEREYFVTPLESPSFAPAPT